MTILDTIVAQVRARLVDTPPDMEALERVIEASSAPVDGLAALAAPGVRVIAEVKRRSPSEGAIRTHLDPAAQARSYAAGGAAAISVLTEPDHFGGSLADLSAVSGAVDVPRLRKDFIVDRRQLVAARAHGASLVLLIAGVLNARELRDLRESAEALGLHALVEAHTSEELGLAIDSGARIIGVNSRDLKDFSVDLARAEAARALIPAGCVAVAESGIDGPDAVRRLHASGYSAFLVGTYLVRAADPRQALQALIEAV